MGCRTEPAAVHIAHVLQRLDFFQFFNFFYNLHDLQQKKILHDLPQKLKNSIFFYNSHDLQQKKKLHAFTAKKKITRLYGFFVHDLHFSRLYGAGMDIILAPLGGSGSAGGGGGLIFCDWSQKTERAIVGKCKPGKYHDQIRCLHGGMSCVPAGTANLLWLLVYCDCW